MRNKAMTGTVNATIGPVMASCRLAAVRSTSSRRWVRSSPASSMSAAGKSMPPVVAVAINR